MAAVATVGVKAWGLEAEAKKAVRAVVVPVVVKAVATVAEVEEVRDRAAVGHYRQQKGSCVRNHCSSR